MYFLYSQLFTFMFKVAKSRFADKPKLYYICGRF